MRETIAAIILTAICSLATSQALALPKVSSSSVHVLARSFHATTGERDDHRAARSVDTPWRLPDPAGLFFVGVGLIGAAALLRRSALRD